MSNPFGENPYASPLSSGLAGVAAGQKKMPVGKVGHVRIFAILNAIQGVLELVMGIVLVFIAIWMPPMLKQQLESDPNFAKSNINPTVFMTAIYGGLAAILILLAVLRIFASIRNYHFQSRVFSIVVLFSGLATLFSCYCLFTAIGLMVYGLIVLFDPSVIEAFRLRAQGTAPDKIYQHFAP